MDVVLTIFTIISGTASILGFLYLYLGKTERFKKVSAMLFALAFSWSLYVLLYPSSTVNNVAGKFGVYKQPMSEDASGNIVIQRGTFTINQSSPKAVEFEFPYVSPPAVEVINMNGYDNAYVPKVVRVTAHQVVFERDAYSGLIPMSTFGWIARGVELERQN